MKTKDPNQAKNKESKFSHFMKAPLRILIKARDFYIRSMTECSGQLDYAMALGCPAGQLPATLPKSFSVNSNNSGNKNEDYSELVRAASSRSLGNRIDHWNLLQRQQARKPPLMGSNGPDTVPRSQSVGIGRIEEEKPCDFGGDDQFRGDNDGYPRSRSYAVSRRRSLH